MVGKSISEWMPRRIIMAGTSPGSRPVSPLATVFETGAK